MSTRYIGKRNNPNFVYPNNNLNEYQTDIVHSINDNSIYGTVTNFTGTSISSTGMTFQFDYSWILNGAEPYVMSDGNYSFLSVHMMAAGQLYFRPWRLVAKVSGAAAITKTGTLSFTVLPSDLGLTSFTNGDYQFDIRMIGKRVVYPVSTTYTVSSIVVPTPTPTPTPSITPTNTPTPTVTPSSGASTLYQSGATLNVTDPGWIRYTTPTGQTYEFISSTGTVTITNCAACSTFSPGFPFADLAVFTVISCGTNCSSVPSVTPTPTPTNLPLIYYRLTDCQTYQYYYSQQFTSGTFNSGDRVEGSSGYYYVVSGTYTSPPAGVDQRYVSATGQFGCP